ncbi:MAG: chromosome partitioning protein ParB [Gammaproteobacteria bacterium]|nr:chromosome partitioning protein ParB [Gammaproteobacteria bacterium]
MVNDNSPDDIPGLYGSPVRLTDWVSEPALADLKADLNTTMAYHDAKMKDILYWNNLKEAQRTDLNDYNKTRSTMEPKLIKKQLGWKYPSLSEPFLGSKKLFKVQPRTFEDELAANQNELVLNYQFDTMIDKVGFIDDFIRAVVDDGTVIVKLGWNQQTKMATRKKAIFSYEEIIAEEEAAAFTQHMTQLAELKAQNAAEFLQQDEATRESFRIFEEQQRMILTTITGYEEEEYERVVANHPTLDVLNPVDFYVDTTCEGDFSKARFAIYCYETTRSDLMKDGRYQNLDTINWDNVSNASTNTELMSGDAYGRDHQYDDVKDVNRKKVKVFEYWGYHDKNGTGIVEPIMASWIDNTMIRLEDNPYGDEQFPFVMAKYLPVKKELYGETDAEILGDNQRTYGGVVRGIVDSLAKSSNSQIGIAKGTLDSVNKEKFDRGENFEFNTGSTVPGKEIIQYTYPSIQPSTLEFLRFISDDAEALTGTRSFSGGVSGDSFGDVAAGVNATLTSTAKREMSILRRLSKAVQEIGSKIAVMNQDFLSEEEVIRITNKGYVTIQREDLKGEYDLIVEISTNELDEKNANDLALIFQTIGPDMQAKLTNEIFGEVAELKRMPALADKIRNSKPTPEEVRINELQTQKLEAELAKINSEIELNKSKADQETSKADLTDTDNIRKASGLEHAEEKEKQSEQSKGNIALEIVKILGAARKEGEKPGDLKTALAYADLNDEKSKTEVEEIRRVLAYFT